MNFLAIGNNEKCPFCDNRMESYLIDGENPFKHFTEKHKKEFEEALFPKNEEKKEK